jgi:hypothetical protein
MPDPLPPTGAPVRVAFIGSAASSGVHALSKPAGGLDPRFFDVRGELRAALADFAPHVVIALAPVPAETLKGLRAATLAVEPTDGFDRAFGDWRARPLPIDDRFYAEVRSSRRPPRALFLGRSTDYREDILTMSKHTHDVVHYTHGLAGDALVEALASADVGIALPAEEGGRFPSQALLHQAAGHLLLSAPLRPSHGLEPGIDHLEVDTASALDTILIQLRLHPEAYERVRIRGRLKADEHRASRVWPRIVADLLQDVRVFGNTLNS